MEEELWLAGMSKAHAKIWADKYDELGRIADSRKVVIEGLEAENARLEKIVKDLSLWASTTAKHLPAGKKAKIGEYLVKHKLTGVLR